MNKRAKTVSYLVEVINNLYMKPAEVEFKAFLINFQLSLKYLISSLMISLSKKVKLKLNEDIDLLLELKTFQVVWLY